MAPSHPTSRKAFVIVCHHLLSVSVCQTLRWKPRLGGWCSVPSAHTCRDKVAYLYTSLMTSQNRPRLAWVSASGQCIGLTIAIVAYSFKTIHPDPILMPDCPTLSVHVMFLPMPLAVAWVNRWTFSSSPPPSSHH